MSFLDRPNADVRKLLIISYLFPPAGGIAVQRALSLAKYLPACGFEVHVLKATNTGGPVFDPELTRQIPPCVRVHRAFTPEVPFALRQKLWAKIARKNGNDGGRALTPSTGMSWKALVARTAQRVLSPEPEILWAPFALRKARQIIREHNIQLVLITVPPFSALVVGSALKREFPKLVLVSDFRDEWLSFYIQDFAFQNSDHTRRRAETIEREAVEQSDLVVAVNRSSRDEIRGRYPEQPEGKFAVLSNGYDPAVFTAALPRRERTERMIVTHVGTVYKTASPRFYLDALEGLPEETRANIETRFIGRIAENEREWLTNRHSPVIVFGFMPQAKALAHMHDTDYLLLTMTNNISIPGKLFEYMATGRPILAVTGSGNEVDQILRETSAGVAADPENPEAIQAMISRAYESWKTGTTALTGDRERIRCYERPQLVAKYGAMLRELPGRAIRVSVGCSDSAAPFRRLP